MIDDKSNPSGISAGLVLASNLLGVSENTLIGIGNAFQAIRVGDIPSLISSASSLASINPRILSAIAGKGASLAGLSPSGLGLGALGGTGVAQSDKFIFSDGGTEKSITFSNLEDAIFGNVSGEATIAAGGALTIAANSIGNNELKQDDDITLQSLTTTNIHHHSPTANLDINKT